MTYAFTFDASACSGCKACQVACKDKNNLPAGVLWRRVYEITGGSWQQMGEAWVTDVFAYNLTIACNHCVHPKCAGVCPTDAYVQREDGIVYIDESKCMGCGYCSWACPYSAPRYNPAHGHMTKCNFCYEDIDAGLPPACVAACPMRVLDIISVSPLPLGASYREGTGQGMKILWEIPGSEHPFPLPKQSRTEPHLAIQSHTAMGNSLEKSVSNWEEIRTGNVKSEIPLVAFTLLGQMAAGISLLAFFMGPLAVAVRISLGVLIGFAGLASLSHLGKPVNAWRSVSHLRKSWLSREILSFGFFAGSWLLTLVMPGMAKLPLAVTGIALVYSMAQVYRLRSIPAWDTGKTLIAFAVSAVVLGSLASAIIFTNSNSSVQFPIFVLIAGLGLGAAFAMSLSEQGTVHQTVGKLRSGLILVGLVGVMIVLISPKEVGQGMIVPLFLITLIEEALGRWLFYEHLNQRAI